MFALVEWPPENEAPDSSKIHHCIGHYADDRWVESDKETMESHPLEGYEYEIVEFDVTEPCPKCGKDWGRLE